MTQRKAKRGKDRFKFLVSTLVLTMFILGDIGTIFGAEGTDILNTLQYTNSQYLELRGTQIVELADGSKQLTMELWGHDLVLKRIWCEIFIWQYKTQAIKRANKCCYRLRKQQHVYSTWILKLGNGIQSEV